MALKLDMSKAYDQVDWHFLEMVLVKVGFVTSWEEKLMKCVKSMTFSFSLMVGWVIL